MPQEQPQKFRGKKCLLPALLQGFNLYGEFGENYKFITTQFTETLLCIIYTTTDFNYVTFDRPNT
jgi:hypothetical protein